MSEKPEALRFGVWRDRETEILRVSNTGEFLWHKDADARIANPGPDANPAMMHLFRALRQAEVIRQENERLQERCDELGSDKERWYRMAELHCTTIDRLKTSMRKAMAMLDKHEPEPAGAFAVLLLALNPELQSAKNAALRREEVKP